MIQVIERTQSIAPQILRKYDGRPQISYNSDNCIVIRIKHKQENGDTLFCLNQTVSCQLINFIKNDISKEVLLNY